jgi:peptidoglycan/xylan/chitin deacetylase (PgdA/CDA1 family)
MVRRLDVNGKIARALSRTRIFRGVKRRLLFSGLKWPSNSRLAAALSFDIDYEEDEAAVPDLLGVLGQLKVQASFACIGRMAKERPGVYADIAGMGHEIVNHSMDHPYHRILTPGRRWPELTADEVMGEVREGREALKVAANYESVGFRTPHFERNPHLPGALKRLGCVYDSSGYDSGTEPGGSLPFFFEDGLLEIPIYREVSSFRMLRGEAPDVEGWRRKVEEIIGVEAGRGGLAVFYFDPMDMGPRTELVEWLVKTLRERGAWIATLREIAEHLVKK